MLSTELIALLEDLESDRVERTISVNNNDKFCQAVCAFSNDFPGHNTPGYLIIGADDRGQPNGLTVTDELLTNLAAIRSSGNILPLSALTIQKCSLPNGELVVVKVFPSDIPPVRYKGRVYIRTGPSKSTANETEERILSERRNAQAYTFDILPCEESALENINFELFKLSYLPQAIDDETLEENHRESELQLSSLRFYSLKKKCPTNAGILLFGDTPLFFLPGAYIQFLRIEGKNLASEVVDEQQFSGDLVNMLRTLDQFIGVQIRKEPQAVSALKEEIVAEYPLPAIREFLMNAVMHRDYRSNAPIRFYMLSDRIEIQNPGGPYGSARPENFPEQNDYRNPVIAEALKILGYVNKFSRGVYRSQKLLQENGNPPAEFTLDQPAHLAVKIKKRPL